MKYIGVKFNRGLLGYSGDSSKIYSFKTTLDVQIGDPVVCDTRYGYTVGTVAELKDRSMATKWAFQKVDKDRIAYLESVEQKKADIEAQLEKKLKLQDKYARYELLAQNDPNAAELLESLKKLSICEVVDE